MQNIASANDEYLSAKKVCARYGVVPMTIRRWSKDPRVSFPEPIYIRNRRFWKVADLDAWERTIAKKRVA